jgi:hypothetical protein
MKRSNQKPKWKKSRPRRSLGRAAVDSTNRQQTMVLRGFSTIASTAGSIINSFIPMDPSGAGFNFAEWTNIAALYSEIKIRSFKIQLHPYYLNNSPTATTDVAPIAVGTNISTSIAPGSEGAVLQLAGAHYLSPQLTNPSGCWHVYRNRGRIGWSTTTSVSTTPYAGAPGCIQIYCAQMPTSSNVMKILVVGEYDVRARA